MPNCYIHTKNSSFSPIMVKKTGTSVHFQGLLYQFCEFKCLIPGTEELPQGNLYQSGSADSSKRNRAMPTGSQQSCSLSRRLPFEQNKIRAVAIEYTQATARFLLCSHCSLQRANCFLRTLLCAGTAMCALLLIDDSHVVLNSDGTGRTVLLADMTCNASY